MSDSSVLSLLRERAGLQPDDAAFTYIDYEQDWAGITETLTWSEVFRRTRIVAHEVRRHCTTGDRAVILAPQGLAYIAAFLGSMQAGAIAVPLSVPQIGSHDERVSAVLADASPSVILTTSAVAEAVAEHIHRPNTNNVGPIIEIDSLDLTGNSPSFRVKDLPSAAYLQYTSGSTRAPAGVMISHRNLQANFQQLMSNYFGDRNGVAPPDTTIVSWLPFYHDMGLVLGIIAPILGGYRSELTSPLAFLQRPARWLHSLANGSPSWSAAPNFAFELAVRKTTDADIEGLDLGNVLGITSGAERVHPNTLSRFCNRFAPYNFREDMIRPSYGLAEATLYVASRNSGDKPEVVYFEPDKLSTGSANRCEPKTGTPLLSYGMPTSPTVRIVDPDTCIECPAGTIGEIWVKGDNVAEGYWNKPDETRHTFGAMLVHPRQVLLMDPGCERRPRIPLRGRDVHRGPYEGHADRIRAQSLPRGHRVDRPGDHWWSGRCDFSSGRSHREVSHCHRAQAPRRFRRRSDGRTRCHQEQRHSRDITLARSQRGGPRLGPARVDPHHNQRQDQKGRLCRAIPAAAIHPVGRLS